MHVLVATLVSWLPLVCAHVLFRPGIVPESLIMPPTQQGGL